MKNKRRKQNIYTRVSAATAIRPEKAFIVNTLLVIGILVALVAYAMMVNHLNTVNFKKNDLVKERARLVERNNELDERIAERQALGTIEERALELGMVPVSEYKFLSSANTVVAQR